MRVHVPINICACLHKHTHRDIHTRTSMFSRFQFHKGKNQHLNCIQVYSLHVGVQSKCRHTHTHPNIYHPFYPYMHSMWCNSADSEPNGSLHKSERDTVILVWVKTPRVSTCIFQVDLPTKGAPIDELGILLLRSSQIYYNQLSCK